MRSLIPILVLLCFFSCKGSTKSGTDESEATIVSLSQEHVITSAEMIDEIEIVPLDSTELIGSVDNLIMTEDRIIIADFRMTKSVYIFDRKGSLLATINRLGRGPQEYISMTHVTLTPDNDRIVIYDNRGGKMLYYTLDGRFVSSRPTPFWFSEMEYTDNEHIVYTTYGEGESDPGLEKYRDRKDLIYFTDSDFNIQKSFFSLNHNKNKFSIVTPNISKHNGQVYVNPVFSDEIFIAEDNELKMKYLIDMEQINGVANFADHITNAEFDDLRKSKATFSGYFTDSENYLLLSITTPPDNYMDEYLYSKRSGTVYFIDKGSFRAENFIRDGVAFAKSSYRDKLISVLQPHSILKIVPEEKRKTMTELVNLTENSNPVIVIYTLKDSL